jgi:TolA-binding protein
MSAVLLSGTTGVLAAEGKTADKDHPRRHEVNKRLDNQNRRINKEVKEGEISKQEAAKLHKEDRQIRQEERTMASQNGGHITKQEQKTLNQQENKVSREVGK